MKVPGIIVARTDAEAATFLDGRGDERDHHFILGATNTNIPNYKTSFLAIMRQFNSKGVAEINGHLMYRISEAAYAVADKWLDKTGLSAEIGRVRKPARSRPCKSRSRRPRSAACSPSATT